VSDNSIGVLRRLGKVLRTREARFADLPGYPFAPRYFDVAPKLRLHYVDEGPKDGPVVPARRADPVVLNTAAAPIWIGNRAHLSRQEASGPSIRLTSNEKDGEKVLSSSLRVAAKKRLRSIGLEQTPRPSDPGPWRALYLAFV